MNPTPPPLHPSEAGEESAASSYTSSTPSPSLAAAAAVQLTLNPDAAVVKGLRIQIEAVLRNAPFPDVTLICEGMIIRTHRIILSLYSGYFNVYFNQNPDPDQVITMPPGLKYWQLKSMLDLIYDGVVTILEDNIIDLSVALFQLQIRILPKDIFIGPSIPLNTNTASNVPASEYFQYLVNFYANQMLRTGHRPTTPMMVPVVPLPLLQPPSLPPSACMYPCCRPVAPPPPAKKARLKKEVGKRKLSDASGSSVQLVSIKKEPNEAMITEAESAPSVSDSVIQEVIDDVVKGQRSKIED